MNNMFINIKTLKMSLEYFAKLSQSLSPDQLSDYLVGDFIINPNASFQPQTSVKMIKTDPLPENMDFAYDYNKALEQEQAIIDTIGFPYYHLFTDDETIRRYMEKLKNYKTKVTYDLVKYPHLKQDKWELELEGDPYTIINYPNEYPDLEIISEYFNQECRVKCIHAPDKDSHLEFFQTHFKDIIDWLQRKKKPVNLKTMDEAIWNIGPSMCTTFKPKIIMNIIKYFNAKRVLDISAGWGDRLIGAIASGVDEYQGYDPSPCVQKGYKKIIEFFKPDGRFVVDQLPFEEAKPTPDHYDLVMSSPPYFDLEVYVKGQGEEKQSIFGVDERKWYDTKLMEWVDVAHKGLRKHGILALNINTVKGQHYVQWLLDDMAADQRWKRLGTISYAKPDLQTPQPIFVWEKK
jgi:hypothetical protein